MAIQKTLRYKVSGPSRVRAGGEQTLPDAIRSDRDRSRSRPGRRFSALGDVDPDSGFARHGPLARLAPLRREGTFFRVALLREGGIPGVLPCRNGGNMLSLNASKPHRIDPILPPPAT